MPVDHDVRALSRILAGKALTDIHVAGDGELEIEFADGFRLFIDLGREGLELSLIEVHQRTGGPGIYARAPYRARRREEAARLAPKSHADPAYDRLRARS